MQFLQANADSSCDECSLRANELTKFGGQADRRLKSDFSFRLADLRQAFGVPIAIYDLLQLADANTR